MADPVKPGNPAAAASAAPAAPKPVASIDDLIERAEDRLIPKGSTVRVSPQNGEVQTKGRKDELEDSLEACGIKVVWDDSLAKDAIVVEAPAAKKPAPQAPAATISSAKPSPAKK